MGIDGENMGKKWSKGTQTQGKIYTFINLFMLDVLMFLCPLKSGFCFSVCLLMEECFKCWGVSFKVSLMVNAFWSPFVSFFIAFCV